ncbi:hypothetical protein RFI_28229 [Reticulomyxa filosa]|uniref:HTH OST-type domain-containing protein n=1 Tax=Reticulomyxa filosa TaxID=46433 RepID=X6M684_RETFI|nr:hypothetical protein RFI_28229 [Reticulomyxa filosa]|eukprot:ETO09156.1 hypothetical protein RFI_28229 [Reticulomyxa filosa]
MPRLRIDELKWKILQIFINETTNQVGPNNSNDNTDTNNNNNNNKVLSLAEFENEFARRHKAYLDPQLYGYHSLYDLLLTLKDILYFSQTPLQTPLIMPLPRLIPLLIPTTIPAPASTSILNQASSQMPASFPISVPVPMPILIQKHAQEHEQKQPHQHHHYQQQQQQQQSYQLQQQLQLQLQQQQLGRLILNPLLPTHSSIPPNTARVAKSNFENRSFFVSRSQSANPLIAPPMPIYLSLAALKKI